MQVLKIKLLFGIWLEKTIQENYFQKQKKSVIKLFCNKTVDEKLLDLSKWLSCFSFILFLIFAAFPENI